MAPPFASRPSITNNFDPAGMAENRRAVVVANFDFEGSVGS
jgi:hypothetical protein